MPTDSQPVSKSSEIIIVIDAERNTLFPDFKEVWRYRDLLTQLAWRDISARYRQSVVGFAWAFIRPISSVITYTFVFSKVAQINTGEVPYELFNLSGLLPWMFISSCLMSITHSVTGSGALLSKAYFPRLILPISSIVVGLIEFAIQFILLLFVMIIRGYYPGLSIIFTPLIIIAMAGLSLGMGLFLTAINVKFRDIGLAVPFFLQLGMFLCPVVYPSSLVPEKWRMIYYLNPTVSLIDCFRWSVIGTPDLPTYPLAYSITFIIFSIMLGSIYFKHIEKSFADNI